jgi:hypothetical protein
LPILVIQSTVDWFLPLRQPKLFRQEKKRPTYHQPKHSIRVGSFLLTLFKLVKLCQKGKLKFEKSNMRWLWRFSIAKSENWVLQKSPDFYIWFSFCIPKYERMIKRFVLHI